MNSLKNKAIGNWKVLAAPWFPVDWALREAVKAVAYLSLHEICFQTYLYRASIILISFFASRNNWGILYWGIKLPKK